ncbi:MAG TPA: hypothetical protein VE291_00075 [Terracidiphilus sp.]|nr:hypothetical protein [Terracidiphilus sp.]
MDTRIFSAYNEASKRSLSPGLIVVDAAREPLKVLKVLMEGLPRSAPDGLWLINFKGVPVARSQSPFDLVYIDDHAHVVQATEITPTSVFEPFRGSPASALILPPRTVSRSKTFTGDRIIVQVAGTLPAPAPPRVPVKPTVARAPARVIPTPASRGFHAPSSGAQSVASGSLLKSAGSVIAPPAEVAQAALAAAAPEFETQTEPQAQAAAPLEVAAEVAAPAIAEVPPAAEDEVAEPSAEVEEAKPKAVSERPLVVDEVPPAELQAQELQAQELQDREPQAQQASAEVLPAENLVPAVAERPEHSDREQSLSTVPADAPSESPADESPTELAAEPRAPDAIPAAPVQEPEHYVVLVNPAPSDDSDSALAVEEIIAAGSEAVTPIPPDEADAQEAEPELAPAQEPEEEPEQEPEQEPELERAPEPVLAALVTQPPHNAALARPLPPILRNTLDVRLLYFLFPKLHPSYRPEFQAPKVGGLQKSKPRDEGKMTPKLRALCWLFPDLQLDTVHIRQREARRAPRIVNPGLIGYFFTGGISKPNEIRNLSVTGFFMKTKERWLTGTVIRITLQMVDSAGDDPLDSITVHTRVVNWNAEGGGFEFVLPGFIH